MTSCSFSSNQEEESVFGDGYCGEPLETQQLAIDFTQNDEDTDFVQNKCCAFWEFIKKHPELEKMMVTPDPIESKSESSNRLTSTAVSSASSTVKSYKKAEKLERTAVSMLEFTEEKGLIDRTFEAKLPYTNCSLGSREYHENERTDFKIRTPVKFVCSCGGMCTSCASRLPPLPVPTSSPEVMDLCKKMQDWDEEHPKIMEEPGHAPTLITAIMQKKVT